MNDRVEELFHQLADFSSELRLRYFAEHDVEPAAREQVEALLAYDSDASVFLRRHIRTAASRTFPQLEGSERRCGPYRIMKVIGRGGMGAVYLAERADGEVIQRVAVKLLLTGACDFQRDQFLQERQILAALSHPNIAHLLDSGHLDNGEPFLVMEYIDGKPIDVFASGLSVQEKVGLFLKVCAAIGYLHRNRVVHRDLKPGNILVTADGEPKLLDFGIAKVLDLATYPAMAGMRALTPEYASPEQIRGRKVSTATDIYSMGAVLYRLLTGKSPQEFEDLSPETVARTLTSGEVTWPSKWAPELKGDLELILLKSLREEPRERYATAEQFGEDLQAFLESRRVKARFDNAWYRARKFLRRYRFVVAALVLAVISFSAGLIAANYIRQ
jgi:serine/threonine-protein kinase